MTSPKIHEVFEYYDKIFQHLYNQPISIKLSPGKHQASITKGRKVVLAFWNIFVVVGIGGGGSTGSIIIATLLVGDLLIPPWQIGLQFLIFIFCAALPVIMFAVILYEDDILCFWNFGVTLKGTPLNLNYIRLINPYYFNIIITEIPPPEPDYLAVFLKLLIHTLVFYLIFVPFFIWFFHLDPVSILASTIFSDIYKSSSYTSKIALDISRLLLAYLVTYQIFTSFVLFIIMACVSIRVFTNAIHSFETQKNTLKLLRRFNLYRYLVKIVDCLSGFALWILVSFTLLLTVINTYATIKLYAVIPMPLYLLAPSLMILAPVFTFSTIVPVVYIHEGSTNILHTQKRNLSSLARSCPYLKRKYFILRIKETYPLTFFAGISGFNFFTFKRSLKKSYLEITLYFTITFLLSVPVELLTNHHHHDQHGSWPIWKYSYTFPPLNSNAMLKQLWANIKCSFYIN